MPIVDGKYRRPQLRNKAINYSYGWFFVTFQVAGNKSELGAIVGEACVLNALGRAVQKLIETLPQFNPGVFVDAFVVMPNHVHLILKIAQGVTPLHPENMGDAISGSVGVVPRREHNLGRIMMKLKSLAAREYRLLKEKGEARDIGSHLWQANYWEKIITSHEQLEAIRAYIADNPKRWSTDRFGPVTTYSQGNLDLLNEPFVAFVASQEARADALAPREWAGGDAPAPREYARGNTLAPQEYAGGDTPAPQESNIGARGCHPAPDAGNLGERGRCAPPVISTFTSPQEREVLRRLLAKGRRFIAVYPGGIPATLPTAIAARVAEGRALLLSPVVSGTGVNKQRAVWCNEYVIRRAKRIWCGAIKHGGTLESILKGAGR